MYEVSMPDLEKKTLKSLINSSTHILEYGSGGSTVYASHLKKTVTTVETDKRFLDDLLLFLNDNSIASFYVNVGSTIEWGHPKKLPKKFSGIDKYATPPWTYKNNYDLVIVDGRFRVLSFMISWNNAKPGTVFFWDDFADRSYYQEVLGIINAPMLFGRAAVWKKRSQDSKFDLAIIQKYDQDAR